ncbi:Chromosome-partitioning protein ParB [Defluviimonas aquaemixtae]|uniref:Chromosome-partitioning protein ParB n=1 Tax=Albidovulum aquaemixtae TaxID=1542388 RepID=A0A2R8BJR1_9RHOB|nr:ParB/RepB/Spo0J family partition protein [Defluviimonas aquaemixtae]SPH23553.1 Chromosome-partitioning protein ParB [Defluviimonas aquaemixtae]
MVDKKNERRGLGRGLSALMADVNLHNQREDDVDAPRRPDLHVPVEKLEANPDQPRRDFSREQLEELADSIRSHGIIQPLIVRNNPRKTGSYEIVAGERRWRAAQMAKLHNVPVLVRDFSDAEMLEVAIIENIQRADLNPVEEALGYRQLMDRFGHTQEKLAEGLSKSRSHIANLLRLLTLPDEVQTWLREGQLSAGHARALVTTEDPVALARQVITRGLSVRETERLAKQPSRKSAPTTRKERPEKDADTRVLEQDLSAQLRMPVVIDHKGHDGGQVQITYRTLEQLDELCQLLNQTR